MSNFSSTNHLFGRLQQVQKQFSTTSANMSQSNKNFLLSEVFNVKGKVRIIKFPLQRSRHTDRYRLLLSQVEEAALA